jgi:hypothetical protein
MDLTLVELSGESATVEIMAIVPDSKVTPVTTVTLAANEMKRISPILGTLGLSDVYNARVTVRVTSGSGRVWAEGTLIDRVTGDRSVIPAE